MYAVSWCDDYRQHTVATADEDTVQELYSALLRYQTTHITVVGCSFGGRLDPERGLAPWRANTKE